MSDGIPHSENTIEFALRAEELGVNALEVDVRKSKDGVLFLYHDATINPRLVRKNTLVGATEDYTWKVLQSEITLLHGEKMPTLEAFLDAVIEKTKVTFVYLDTKTTGANIIADMIPIQKRALEKAAAMGRSDLKIYIGIPNQDLLDELKAAQKTAGDVPSLIETSPDDCVDPEVMGDVWSPRWSEGTQNAKVAELQARGLTAVTWTLDVDSYIQQYLAVPSGRFNGFLTNYPMLVKYHILKQ
jgi:glycerophosphoryl diester phosphodiesterase